MERLTVPFNGRFAANTGITYWDIVDRLADYEDAEEQGLLVRLPCKVGDKVRDKIADYVFTIDRVEWGNKSGMLFRCGNPGTDDYMAFYDFEIGEKIEILTRQKAEAALAKDKNVPDKSVGKMEDGNEP